MTEVTRLLFIADEVRDHPVFLTGALRGSEPSIITRVNPHQREQMIAQLCATLRGMCDRGKVIHHVCVTVEAIACIQSVHLTFIYGRHCLKSSEDVEAYLQAAYNIAHRARLASVREATEC